MEIERCWPDLADSFERAAASAGLLERDIVVGAVPVRLRFAGVELHDALFPAFAHLAAGNGAAPERTVLLFDTASSGVARPAQAWGPRDVGALGELIGLSGGPLRGVVHQAYDGLQLFDSRSGTLVYHVPSAPALPWYERAAPMRAGLHWLLGMPGRQLVHAAAVGEDGKGALLAGAGGSGKSTLAMACLEGGLDLAGEDYAVLTTRDGLVAHSLYCTAKLDQPSLARLSASTRAIVNPDFTDEEKAVLLLDPQRLQRSVPISCVILPVVTGADPPRLVPASGGEALLALGPSSTFQLPSRQPEMLATLAELARRVPAWRLELGEDLEANVDCVRRALAEAR